MTGRELIAPKDDKRYVRRGKNGRFKGGRALAADVRPQAKRKAKPGAGDRGDRKTR